jgi:membrane dipeptidase
MSVRAEHLLDSAPVIDGHNDILWELRHRVGGDFDRLDLAEPQPEVMTDIPRIRRGRLGGQYWSVYVPSDLPGHEAVTATLEQFDAFDAMLARYPETFERARTADDIERVTSAGRVASMAGVEGGHSIGCSMGALRTFAQLGAGYMTLTHNDNTPWADSATDEPVHGGLTRFGEEVVREMNRLGVLVDLSHTSPDTMRHAIDVGAAPSIFSHSNARTLCDVSRNVPDDVLERVRDTNGVVMVTFVPSFLTREGAEANRVAWEEARRLKALHPKDPAAARSAMKAWFDSRPEPPASVGDVADHVDHIREVAGIDHLGIGGDLDGMPSTPVGLEDVACYPNLFAELQDRGYADDDLARLARGNILRVLREAEVVAARIRSERGPSHARIEELDA